MKTAYGFDLSDFCVDAQELQITQRTDSSRIHFSDSCIKTSGFVFADSTHVVVCFYLVSDGRCSINFSLKTPQSVIITQRSASEPKAAGPVRSTRAILERHLADKIVDLPNFLMSI